MPGLARRGAEVGAHPPGSVGRWAGVPGAVPCCSGRPRVQVIQDRLWSGQSACSRLLGSGAGRTLRPGRASRAVASPQPTPGSPHGAGHRQPSASLTQQGAAGWAPGHGCPPGWAWGCWGGGIHRVAGACGALPSAPCPQVYVLKRPHVDEFLQRMGELFECVLFTASLAKVGAPPPRHRHRPPLPGHPSGGTTPLGCPPVGIGGPSSPACLQAVPAPPRRRPGKLRHRVS